MKTGIAGKIAQAFINSKLTPLLAIAFLVIGLYTAYLTPREEEPQINVPMADIFIRYPGANPKEVEQRISIPMEKVISNIDGIEYVYSTSMPGQAMLSARFYVGKDVERSLVKLYTELMKHMDQMPPGASMPLIKTRSIDDVPILSLTLWSKKYSDYQLRRMADELSLRIKQVSDVAETQTIGGRTRQVRVELDKNKMEAYHVDPLIIAQQIKASNSQMMSGSFSRDNKSFVVETGHFLKTDDDVKNLVIGAWQGSPVYLKTVATIKDGPSEPSQYVSFGYGAAHNVHSDNDGLYPAVTIAVAKRKGTDAMRIADEVIEKVNNLKGEYVPSDVHISITRNYGETASDKVSELLFHLFVAIVAVTLLVMATMGWRSALVNFASIPITFALTLFVYYMFGYTLNRITLFALVFVTGIVVDDSIIVVENMHRHFMMKKLPFYQAALASIDEVGNPTILATFTVIAAVLPMAFVSGLMGPYMSPMPIGASIAMLFSLMVALIITPWLSFRLLKNDHGHSEKEYKLEETMLYRAYDKTLRPLMDSGVKRWGFIIGVVVLLLISMTLFYFRLVQVKMLPFDNKNEIQVVIDTPEGTPLEQTYAAAQAIALQLKNTPQLDNYQIYAGTSSPINFNGLVRHYDLRKGPNMADIQLNLVDKGERSKQSHEIATEIRPLVHKIAGKFNANAKVVEVPPGPPVLSTLVAEVYGPNFDQQIKIARKVKQLFQKTDGIVDVDWMMEDDQVKYDFIVDKEQAMLKGVAPQQITHVLGMALHGQNVSQLSNNREVEAVPIHLQLTEQERSSVSDLKGVYVRSQSGAMVPVSDLVTVKKDTMPKSIFRKNQRRVIYVTADVAGAIESPVYAILDLRKDIDNIAVPAGYNMTEYFAHQPFSTENYSVKWDGEWQITYEVFRDLGAAFAVVLLIIYMLIIAWFQDFKVPLIMMVAIPLSLIGIVAAHLLFGAFFTATSMIGMIALAGIMVRNSVLLIDFIQIREEDGVSLKDAVIEAGAVRTRPILLTTGAVIIGAFVIIFDPIFQGLALSLIGGAIASTALTLVIVPLIYYMAEKKHKTD